MRTWPALEVAPPKQPELLQAALVDFRIAAVDEGDAEAWRVFFTSEADRDAAARALTHQFPDLSIRPLNVSDEDWVAKSQASLRAVRIEHIIVAPPWDVPHTGRLKPIPPGEAGPTKLRRPLVIVIRPSIGFGTGHHPTTRLCLTALQQIDLDGRTVVDVGTGSGVLAIAASRLGAARVIGIDEDRDALQSAEENLTLNRGAEVVFRGGDARTMKLEPLDVVVANVTSAFLQDAAGALRALAAPGAQLILSGFLRDEEALVLSAYSDLPVTRRAEEDQWVCVTLRRP